MTTIKEINRSHPGVLAEIRFGFLDHYNVAGMAEPWLEKIGSTINHLKKQGIGAILTLTEAGLYSDYYIKAGFMHLHEPINDCEAPGKEGMDRALSFINSSLEMGKGAAVHCLEGRGRTGLVLCAWLALEEKLRPDDALRRIHELRPVTVISDAQKAFLYRYLSDK